MRSGRHISSQLPGSDPPGAPFDSPYGWLVHSENTHSERAKVKRRSDRSFLVPPETSGRCSVPI